ncbi:alpha/beta hydrolase [Corallococcus sp. H22C18031201]|uniref:alpha/beta fold hydrolase n=1 Tax=Citreicoccus inhibens TaxID=2849499 RepID=UPI000E772E76|nr:alpha/beta hydrolase [Citreicoccus inhibens]MBU8895750.1 alpha/beta hydrolase [Citreicoccus inhibens]RJS20168.1 alpha/beta hydrolase [Corallococcus sp. H22C18031201]
MKHKAPSTVTVQGPAGRLVATVEGEGGIPVLFVHDLAADRTHWAEAQHGMETRTAALDLRGLGESAGGHGPFGIEAAVEDIAAFADAQLPMKFVLVGHGFGGAVAGAFAAYYPERLAGLLYVDAVGDFRATPAAEVAAFLGHFTVEHFSAFREQWLLPLLVNAKDTTRTRVLSAMRTSRREAIAGNLESLFHHDPGEAFASFMGPTHALAATTTPDTLVAQHPELVRSLAPHASHWLMLDAPKWFHDELTRFLGECRHAL